MSLVTSTTIESSHKGEVSPGDLDRAVDKVRSAADRAREPVHHLEVRISLESNPAHERPARAEATIDVNGSLVRAHVVAPTVSEAVDDLVDRLRRRLDRHEDRLHHLHDRRRTGDSGPHEWQHGDLPSDRPPWLDLPYQEREIRRRKTFAMEPMTIEEAAFDLVQLDHAFYLFVDQATGSDAVVAHDGEGSLTLQVGDGHPEVDETVTTPRPALVIESPAPVLDEVAAKEHLEASGSAWLFYVSDTNGRGAVLYRRDDGHYGLIEPR